MKELNIYGIIGRDIRDTDFIQLLKQCTGDIRININSKGGSVFEGYAIYNAIREYSGNVHIHIDGLAASMASLICLAGNKIIMAENALYMIHNPKVDTFGDSRILKKNAEMLDKVKNIMLDTYYQKTRMLKEELSKMLDNETWLSAAEALEMKFIDEIKGYVLQAISKDIYSQYISEQTENNRFSWSLEDWIAKDPEGLEKLANTNPTDFKQLNDSYFKNVPDDKNTPKTNVFDIKSDNILNINSQLLTSRLSWSLEDWINKDPEGLEKLANTNPTDFKQLNDSYFKNVPDDKNTPKTNVFDIKSDNILNINSQLPTNRLSWSLEDWINKDPEGLEKLADTNPSAFKQLNDTHFDTI